MKPPEEYVAAAVPAGRVVCSIPEATTAVAQALADAERYKDLLLASLRRYNSRKPWPPAKEPDNISAKLHNG